MVEIAFEFFYSSISVCSVPEEGGPGTDSVWEAFWDGIRKHTARGWPAAGDKLSLYKRWDRAYVISWCGTYITAAAASLMNCPIVQGKKESLEAGRQAARRDSGHWELKKSVWSLHVSMDSAEGRTESIHGVGLERQWENMEVKLFTVSLSKEDKKWPETIFKIILGTIEPLRKLFEDLTWTE